MHPTKGALWYQGEANTGDTQEQYAALLSGMIADWRGHWKDEFDFLVVGLVNCGDRHTDPVESGWAEVRAAEASVTAADPHSGLAEALDVGAGHNIHPLDKQDVGRDILVWADQAPAPVAVRYAWQDNPPANLYNKAGFPAVPFRTQEWRLNTK